MAFFFMSDLYGFFFWMFFYYDFFFDNLDVLSIKVRYGRFLSNINYIFYGIFRISDIVCNLDNISVCYIRWYFIVVYAKDFANLVHLPNICYNYVISTISRNFFLFLLNYGFVSTMNVSYIRPHQNDYINYSDLTLLPFDMLWKTFFWSASYLYFDVLSVVNVLKCVGLAIIYRTYSMKAHTRILFLYMNSEDTHNR